MTEAWWTNDALWVLPLFLPLALGGPLAFVLVRYVLKGQHRARILFLWIALTVFYGLVGVVGVFARYSGQPDYVWVCFWYPGIYCGLAYGLTYPLMRKTYARAELRKIAARDI